MGPKGWYYKLARWGPCATSLNTEKKSKEYFAKTEATLKKSVKTTQVFESSTLHEKLIFLLGLLVAIFMGCLVPFFVITYSEFLELLIARHSPGTIIPKYLVLQFYGGGSTNTSGSYEERMDYLMDDAMAYLLSILSFSTTFIISSVLSIYALNYSALKKLGRIRRQFLESILHQDIAWHDTHNTGAFATTFTDSLDKIYEGVGEKLGILTFMVATFVASIIILLFYGWELTLAMATICPIFIISALLVSKIQTILYTKEYESNAEAGAVVEEVLSNIRTVAAFGGEDKEVQRYEDTLAPAKKVGVINGIYTGIGSGVFWMMLSFSYAIAFWFGVPLVLADRDNVNMVYSPSVLIMILFAVVNGITSLGLCSPHLEACIKGRAASNLIMEILKRKPTIDVNAEGIRLDSNFKNIEFNKVCFSYPARPNIKILDGLSFRVNEGESVAIVGGSGSGKSTVIQLIERFYDPDAGSVLLNGVDIKHLDLKWVRRQIGLVGQEPVLFNETIRENICCDLQVTEKEMEQAAREANAHDFIMKLPMKYDTMVGEHGSQLSGGQKQRIAIARALVRQPRLLLLDEATSALDMNSEAVVQNALDRTCQGRTTIIISHRLTGIRNVDRIIVIANGRVIEEGNHEKLMALRGHYYSLVAADAPLQADSNLDKGYITLKQTVDHSTSEETYSLENETDTQEDKNNEDYKVPFLKILALNKPEWPYVLLGSVASFLNGCLSPASAILFGYMYGMLSSSNEEEVKAASSWYAIAFIIIGILSFICIFLQNATLTLAGVRMIGRLRVNVFRAILQQEMAWFDDKQQSVGSLCAKLSGDTATVQGATGSKLGILLQVFSSLGVGTITSLIYSWKMTIICLILVPLLLFTLKLEERMTVSDQVEEKKALADATKIAVEALTSVRTIQSIGQETAVLERYTRKLEQAEAFLRHKTRFRGAVFGLGQVSTPLSFAVSLYIGGFLVANYGESYRNIIIVSEALLFGATMLSHVITFAPDIQFAKMAANRLFKIFNRMPPKCKYLLPPDWTAEGDIDYSDVQFAYPSRPEVKVLQGLQLNIAQGQKVALVGPSGCGKSTCIQLLQRFYDPVSGEVKINKKDTTELPLNKLRAEIGIVSQEPVLFNRTIAENIAYGDNTRTVSMAEIVSVAKKANVHEFITSLPAGYETKLGSKGTQLSGGQKQRIAIARSLIRNPRILVLDEATSALDSQSEKTVQKALDDASVGRTCIAIAHRLSTISNADMICVLNRGVIIEQGSHMELLAQGGHYANLLQQQSAAACSFPSE